MVMITESSFADILAPALKRIFIRSFLPEDYVQLNNKDRGWEIYLPCITNYHSKKRFAEAEQDLNRALETIKGRFWKKIKEIRKAGLEEIKRARNSKSSATLQHGKVRGHRRDRRLVTELQPRKRRKVHRKGTVQR